MEPTLRVYRFTYVGSREFKFEAIPWYKYKLRGFLYDNWGKAVWLMGGIGTREAFLVIEPELDDKIPSLTKPLRGGGRFAFLGAPLSEQDVLKIAESKPIRVGYLERLKLGEEVPDGVEISMRSWMRQPPRVKAWVLALLSGISIRYNPLPHYYWEPVFLKAEKITGVLKTGRKLLVTAEKILVKPLNPAHEPITYEKASFTLPLHPADEYILSYDELSDLLCFRRVTEKRLKDAVLGAMA